MAHVGQEETVLGAVRDANTNANVKPPLRTTMPQKTITIPAELYAELLNLTEAALAFTTAVNEDFDADELGDLADIAVHHSEELTIALADILNTMGTMPESDLTPVEQVVFDKLYDKLNSHGYEEELE